MNRTGRRKVAADANKRPRRGRPAAPVAVRDHVVDSLNTLGSHQKPTRDAVARSRKGGRTQIRRNMHGVHVCCDVAHMRQRTDWHAYLLG